MNLSEHKGDARPNTLIHLNVRDIDAVAREFGMAVDEESCRAGVRSWKASRATGS